ncbi:MAG: orotate phosphoribosyltransferase [Calditrichota bacterium]
MSNSFDMETILRESKALLQGHFLLTSGMHSPHYYEKFRLLENPVYTSQVASALADRFQSKKIDVVAGAAIGGIILAYEVARAVGVRCMFAERMRNTFTFRRGFHIGPEENVLLVEDIVTTGASVLELRDLVRTTGARIQGIGILVDRSNGTFEPDEEWSALYTASVENYAPEECPLCKETIPLTSRGRTGKRRS